MTEGKGAINVSSSSSATLLTTPFSLRARCFRLSTSSSPDFQEKRISPRLAASRDGATSLKDRKRERRRGMDGGPGKVALLCFVTHPSSVQSAEGKNMAFPFLPPPPARARPTDCIWYMSVSVTGSGPTLIPKESRTHSSNI